VKIFVKNIDRDINEAQLEGMFAKYGEVESTKIIYDTITWQSKGFAFVEMLNKNEARKAIEELNGQSVNGRELIVQEAEDRPRR
jgi:RNA recognition motif-containing protein